MEMKKKKKVRNFADVAMTMKNVAGRVKERERQKKRHWMRRFRIRQLSLTLPTLGYAPTKFYNGRIVQFCPLIVDSFVQNCVVTLSAHTFSLFFSLCHSIEFSVYSLFSTGRSFVQISFPSFSLISILNKFKSMDAHKIIIQQSWFFFSFIFKYYFYSFIYYRIIAYSRAMEKYKNKVLTQIYIRVCIEDTKKVCKKLNFFFFYVLFCNTLFYYSYTLLYTNHFISTTLFSYYFTNFFFFYLCFYLFFFSSHLPLYLYFYFSLFICLFLFSKSLFCFLSFSLSCTFFFYISFQQPDT